MNPYQILGMFGLCSIVSGLLVAALTAIGGSILAALCAVYLATIWMMLGMQRRARETSELRNINKDRPFDSAKKSASTERGYTAGNTAQKYSS